MEEKVPFYMTYPMQNLYSAELEYEKDMERVRELYPREIAFIQEAVEKHCDKLEYEGSPMFAMYPDRETIYGISRIIYDKVRYKLVYDICESELFEIFIKLILIQLLAFNISISLNYDVDNPNGLSKIVK